MWSVVGREVESVERSRVWRGRECGEVESVERSRVWRGRECGEGVGKVQRNSNGVHQ